MRSEYWLYAFMWGALAAAAYPSPRLQKLSLRSLQLVIHLCIAGMATAGFWASVAAEHFADTVAPLESHATSLASTWASAVPMTIRWYLAAVVVTYLGILATTVLGIAVRQLPPIPRRGKTIGQMLATPASRQALISWFDRARPPAETPPPPARRIGDLI